MTDANFYQVMPASGNGARQGCMSNGQAATNAQLYAYYTKPSLSYNAETGILTSGNGQARGRFIPGNGFSASEYNAYMTLTTTAYCVYIDYE